MIKCIVYVAKAVLLAILALFVTSCKYDIDLGPGLDGSGNIVTEKRNINESFSKIEVSRGIEVIVDQDDFVEVEVEADDNIIKHITTKVVNDVLVISSDENIDSAEAETVHVKMPKINSLEATSGSNIKSNRTLKGRSLRVRSSSGSEIDIAVEYDTVDSEASSGSNTKLSGKALKLSTASSSGSEINAGSLMANEINSESTSGSSTDVHPLVVLKAKASSGSSIDYHGSPKTVKAEESSGGDVSKN